jgi:hypothetical protein
MAGRSDYSITRAQSKTTSPNPSTNDVPFPEPDCPSDNAETKEGERKEDSEKACEKQEDGVKGTQGQGQTASARNSLVPKNSKDQRNVRLLKSQLKTLTTGYTVEQQHAHKAAVSSTKHTITGGSKHHTLTRQLSGSAQTSKKLTINLNPFNGTMAKKERVQDQEQEQEQVKEGEEIDSTRHMQEQLALLKNRLKGLLNNGSQCIKVLKDKLKTLSTSTK